MGGAVFVVPSTQALLEEGKEKLLAEMGDLASDRQSNDLVAESVGIRLEGHVHELPRASDDGVKDRLEVRDDVITKWYVDERGEENRQVVCDEIQDEYLLRPRHFVVILGSVVLEFCHQICDIFEKLADVRNGNCKQHSRQIFLGFELINRSGRVVRSCRGKELTKYHL